MPRRQKCRVYHRHQLGAMWTTKDDPMKDSPASATEWAKAKHGYEAGEHYSGAIALSDDYKTRWLGTGVWSLKEKRGATKDTGNYVGSDTGVNANSDMSQVQVSIPTAQLFATYGIMNKEYISALRMISLKQTKTMSELKRMHYQVLGTLPAAGTVINCNQLMKQFNATGSLANQGQNYFTGNFVFPEALQMNLYLATTAFGAPVSGTTGVYMVRVILFQWNKPTRLVAATNATPPTVPEILEYVNNLPAEVTTVISPYRFENEPYLIVHYDEVVDMSLYGRSLTMHTTASTNTVIKTWKDTHLRRIDFQNDTSTNTGVSTVPQAGGFYLLMAEQLNYTGMTYNVAVDVTFRDGG